MNHKRKRHRRRRASCSLCKPSKKFHVTADRMKARRDWRRDWGVS
jgi:hypothetical protein